MSEARQSYTLDDLIPELGTAGIDLTQLNAAEASAGNISVFVRELSGFEQRYHRTQEIPLPVVADALAGGWLVVSGTGRRLRDIRRAPEANLCILYIQDGGTSAVLYSGVGLRPTSEFNSHLAVHNDQVGQNQLDFHAVVHAQPRYLTYLSHHPAYATTASLNAHLLRWEPETIMAFPEGIALIPFQVPGTPEQMKATIAQMRSHRAVVWQRHGILTRSDASIQKASDLVEYAEAVAHFEYLNLQVGEPSRGISLEDLVGICEYWKISAPVLELIKASVP